MPSDLSATFTFGGYTITEYPGGQQPEVIAWSSIAGRPTGVKGALNPRRFGAIGAYDGHRQEVGRVVVDATWHHFFDGNLIGELGNADPVKSVGFQASVQGTVAFEDISAYFRNIAVWLARPSSQRCMWWRAVWWLRWHHVIAMDLRPAMLRSARDVDLRELIRIGGEARDVLGRVASQCTATRWVWGWVLADLRVQTFEHARHLDPWFPQPPEGKRPVPEFDIASPATGELLVDVALGAMVYAVAREFPDQTDETRKAAEDADWGRIVDDQLTHAFGLLGEHTRDSARRLAELGEQLGGPATTQTAQ